MPALLIRRSTRFDEICFASLFGLHGIDLMAFLLDDGKWLHGRSIL
jgi:hypothetical protein